MTEIGSSATSPTAANVSLAPIPGMTANDVQEGIEELKVTIDKGSVSVTADGVKSISALFDELFALIDTSKLRATSVLVRERSSGDTAYHIGNYGSSIADFGCVNEGAGLVGIRLTSSGSSCTTTSWAPGGTSYTYADQSSTVPTNGTKYTVKY